MRATLPVPDEVKPALFAAVAMHGIRGAKDAIRSAWCNGGYSRQGLSDYSGTLQRWRNSEHGHTQLENLRISDYKKPIA